MRTARQKNSLFKRPQPFPVAGAIALIAVLAGAYPTWRFFHNKQKEAFAKQALSFRQESLEKFQKGELPPDDMITRLRQLADEFAGKTFLAPLIADVANELLKAKHYGQTVDILKAYERERRAASPYLKLLLGLQLAGAQEDLGHYDEAIATLNDLLPLKLSEDKIYFDLGRYHRLKGNAPVARQSFDYVITKYPDSPLADLSQTYRDTLPPPSP